jgi:N-acyl-L-homoserine lactone synthetase
MFNLRDANYNKELPWNCIFKEKKIKESDTFDENNNPFCDGSFEP